MYEHGPDTRWSTWYDMMYTLYDMNYMTDRLHRYSIDYDWWKWTDMKWFIWMIGIYECVMMPYMNDKLTCLYSVFMNDKDICICYVFTWIIEPHV